MSVWRRVRLALVVLVVLGWAPLLAVTVSRALGGHTDWVAQLASFAPLAGVGWAVALLVLAALRSWWPALVAGLLVAVHVVWLAPPVVQRFQADPAPRGTPVRVLTINAQYGGADADQLARLIEEQKADIVAVQELTTEFAARLGALVQQALPYRALYPWSASAAGSGIWSRWPMRPYGLLASPFRMPRVQVAVPGLGRVDVVGVHAMSPTPGAVTTWRRDLATLARRAAVTTRPLIMLGDFNATRDHGPFRSILAGRLADAQDGAVIEPWAGQSWPADRRFVPPVIRIDHVLASRDAFAVTGVRTIGVAGTDHRAVLADLVVRAPATAAP